MKRVFIAIKIEFNEESIELIETIKIQLKDEKIKWVHYHNYHLTLHFFGNVSGDEISLIKSSLQHIFDLKAFDIKVEELEIFSRNGKPTVLFVKIASSQALDNLNSALQDQLKNTGFKTRIGLFKPHLTIGRIKKLANKQLLSDLIFDLRHCYFQTSKAEKVILFKSELTPQGTKYSELINWKLE